MNGIDIRRMGQRPQVRKLTANGSGEASSSLWSLLNKDIQLFDSISLSTKESFYHELAILINAGVDLKASLDLLIAEQTKQKNKLVMQSILRSVLEGGSLSQAMQKEKGFTAYEYFSVQIGEETGRLVGVLENLAEFFKKQIKQKRQITGAMMYPIIVTLTSFVAVFFMLNFIVPMFADIFSRTGGKLPAVTQLIVDISAFMKIVSIPLFIGTVVLIVLLFVNRKKDVFRRITSALILRLPLFGNMVRKVYLGRLCNSMALLTAAKVPLIRAIQLSKQMVGFYPIEVSLAKIEDDILTGKPLYSTLSQFKIYDSKMIALIKVGEEVNELAGFFEKVSKQYNEEVEHQSALLSSVMEPFIIIFLGLFVGLILIAMYLPLFQIGNGFE